MARPRSKHFVPYDKAKQFVKEASIRNRDHYWKWHKETNPNYLPRHPHNHYEEWISWNDFLGNANSFDKTRSKRIGEEYKKKWRPYWDAVRWSQAFCKKHNITSEVQWIKRYEELDIPKDIPKRPYHAYNDEGFSWFTWLGKTVEAQVANAQSNIAFIAFHHVAGEPPNVIKMKVWKDGYVSMLNNLEAMHLDKPSPKCMWKMDKGAIEFTERMLHQHGHNRGDSYVIPNINALLWSMMDLEIYQYKKQ